MNKTIISILIFIGALLGGVYLLVRKAMVPLTLLAVIYMVVWHVLPQLVQLSGHL